MFRDVSLTKQCIGQIFRWHSKFASDCRRWAADFLRSGFAVCSKFWQIALISMNSYGPCQELNMLWGQTFIFQLPNMRDKATCSYARACEQGKHTPTPLKRGIKKFPPRREFSGGFWDGFVNFCFLDSHKQKGLLCRSAPRNDFVFKTRCSCNHTKFHNPPQSPFSKGGLRGIISVSLCLGGLFFVVNPYTREALIPIPALIYQVSLSPVSRNRSLHQFCLLISIG